jgi:hypothetical protein
LAKICENRQKSAKICENLRNSAKICENRQKSVKIVENWQKIVENRQILAKFVENRDRNICPWQSKLAANFFGDGNLVARNFVICNLKKVTECNI